jgi:hypothetical protein
MTSNQATKAEIRKRMFFASEARGESGDRFGFQWCVTAMVAEMFALSA